MVTVNSNCVVSEFRRAAMLKGICAQVAKELGLTVQHVSQVALGNRKSSKVLKAIERRYRQRERLREVA